MNVNDGMPLKMASLVYEREISCVKMMPALVTCRALTQKVKQKVNNGFSRVSFGKWDAKANFHIC